MDDLILINDQSITPLDYKGKRVLTFKMIDRIHKKGDGSARRRFADNKTFFDENEDYFIVQGTELTSLRQIITGGIIPDAANRIALFTESGYLLLVKSFNDDFAWKTQKLLVKCYFAVKEKNYLPQTFAESLRLLADQVDKNQLLENKIQEDQPKVEFADQVKSSDTLLTVGQAAKVIAKKGVDTGEGRLFKVLKDKHGPLYLLINTTTPTQYAVENKWLELDPYPWEDKKGRTHIYNKVKVTGKGLIYIEKKLRRIKEDELAREQFFKDHPPK